MNDTENKKQEVIRELDQWFAKPNCEEFYHDEPLKTVEEILSEDRTRKSVWLSFDQLENWYKNNFVYKGLKENDCANQTDAAAHGYFILELTSLLARYFPNNPPSLDFHKAAGYLANVIIQKWSAEAAKALEMILEGLDTKLLKGGQNYKTAAWFIITVACRALNKNLPTGKYNYPPDMKIYQSVIDKWNTPYEDEVDKLVSALCDYHLQQATAGDGKNVLNIQFSFVNEFVYAYEILAWLSLREMNNLPNPENFTHPLMQLSVNQLPKSKKPMQATDLYNALLTKLSKEFSQAQAQ